METQKKKSIVKPIIITVIVLIVAYFAYKKIVYSMHNEDTENSQIECNIYPITPRISGYVTSLNVKENQHVNKGDTLLTIDDRDLQIKVQQAEIALQNAIANTDIVDANIHASNASSTASNDNVVTQQANVDAAKVRVWKANQDYTRYKNLLDLKSVTQQQFDAINAEKQTAEKLLVIAEKAVSASKGQTSAVVAQEGSVSKQKRIVQLNIEQRKQDLDFVKLQLSYATIISPTNGFVSKKNIQVGQLVNVGSNLFSLIDESSLWITANFKETQMTNMKEHQKVAIDVDAYPNVKFEGEIESISAATGSKFALLPPDNSTGNFVKVVQRIPVRITIKNEDATHPLRAGMNVTVAVKTK